MVTIKKTEKKCVGEDVEKMELSHIADWNIKRYSHFGKQFVSFLNIKPSHSTSRYLYKRTENRSIQRLITECS